MIKTKVSYIRIIVIMAVFLLAYLVSSLFKSNIWGNILSPLNALIATGILFFAYLRSGSSVKVRVILLLYALACAAWGVADILWAIIDFSGGSPDESMVLLVIYAMPNCFLLLSVLAFTAHQFHKWDLAQFVIDIFVNVLLITLMFWIVFLRKDFTILNALIQSDFTSILSIATDVVICILVFSWLLSVRKGKIPSFVYIIALGLVMFSWADLLYYYLDYSSLYFPNTIIDFLYILAMVIIAFGALWKIYRHYKSYDFSIVTNVGGGKRWGYLLLYPLGTIMLSVFDFLNMQVNSVDIFIFAMLIVMYWAACKYIQLSLEKEALLKHQKEILEQRVAEQVTELNFLVNQDTLTTLFNRHYFMDCLDEALEKRRPNEVVALLVIDVDRFKTINDTYGHDIGDKVLIDLSRRMIAWNNIGATIARLGADEFAVMVVGKYTHKDIENICMEILNLNSMTVSIGEHKLSVTTSVGVAIATTVSCHGKTIMQNADIAMYQAKSQGYNRFLIYDALMSQDFKKALEIEALLRQTDAKKDFELYYQPQYALPDKKLIGAEALIRWNNREHGFIPPNVFIPIAEQIDYIFKIGEWVMQESVRQAEMWNREYDLQLKIGFNISPKQFQNESFINRIKTLIEEEEVNPALLDAEITESVMMGNEDSLRHVFTLLHKLGITISIDDFGAGYSALGNLNKFPFDRVKIDKSLIDNISNKSLTGINVVRAAINMAHASGIITIAEGVETLEQLDSLCKLDCDQVQGYLLGRPVPADVFEDRYIKLYIKGSEVS